jgi:segregation and condensation protein A
MADADAGRAGEGAAPSPGGPTGDPLWDDWDTPPRAPTIPDLHLDGFDGPLDLLLDLAERQRIDLGRLSIADLATQFVAALDRLAGHVALERRADWLVMATHLVLLRSRLLFPANPEAAAEAERDAAAEARRIEELRFIRAAAAWLSARPALGVDVFARPAADPPRATGYVALMEACLTVLRGRNGRPADAPVYHPALPDLWRVPAAVARIRAMLAARPAGGDLAGFLPVMDAAAPDHTLQARAAVASTFVAGLELARAGQVGLDQPAAFAAITLRAQADPADHTAQAA